MKKILVSSIVAGMLCATALNATTYAVVDGQKITEADLDFFKQMVPNFDFNKLSQQDKEAVINQLVERRLALLAAKKDKIDKDKEYKEALNMFKNNLAIDLWIKKQQQKLASEISISKEEAKSFYEKNKNFFIEQKAQARMIVVKTKEEAEKIINDLKNKKGDDLLKSFIKLANEKSIDPSVQKSQNGGDLGEINRNQMLPQFTNAVFGLKAGSITTTPIQTESGYHIIYLASKTEPKTISFEQAEGVIENNLKQQKITQKLQEELANMRKKAKVKIEPIK